jgi:hypothetical protein
VKPTDKLPAKQGTGYDAPHRAKAGTDKPYHWRTGAWAVQSSHYYIVTVWWVRGSKRNG